MKRVERVWIAAKKVKALQKMKNDLAHLRNLFLLLIYGYKEKYGEWIYHSSILYTLIADRRNEERWNYKKEIIERIERDEDLAYWLKEIKNQKEKIANAHLVQDVIRQIDKDFRSYRSSIKEYEKNPEKFRCKPRPPKPRKLKNVNKFTVSFNRNTFSQRERKIALKVTRDKTVKLKISDVRNVTSVRLCFLFDSAYADVVYDVDNVITKPLNNYEAAADLNVDNLMVIVSTNPMVSTTIISGKVIKAYNQWFNKKKSEIQSVLAKMKKEKGDCDELRKLERKLHSLLIHRKRFMDDMMHKISRNVADFLYTTGHSVIYVGKITEAKNECDIGRNTEGFMYIPYRSLIDKIKYKCEERGIKVFEVEEAWTSKACCINDDIFKIKEGEANPSGVRNGSFYRTKIGEREIVTHADANAAFNILRVGAKIKNLSKLFDLKTLLRKLCSPIRVAGESFWIAGSIALKSRVLILSPERI